MYPRVNVKRESPGLKTKCSTDACACAHTHRHTRTHALVRLNCILGACKVLAELTGKGYLLRKLLLMS